MDIKTKIMNSPGANSSPTFKHLNLKHSQSPIELKEKMRKNYKDKVKNCREMLLNKFRGSVVENNMCETLSNIYKNMFNYDDNPHAKDEEIEVLEELKNEFVQEELEWWLKESEKFKIDNIDWELMEQEHSVICPVCQKTNFKLENDAVSCSCCKIAIKTKKKLSEINKSILNSLEKHNVVCSKVVQFTILPEFNESHIYLICDSCTEIIFVI